MLFQYIGINKVTKLRTLHFLSTSLILHASLLRGRLVSSLGI